MSTAWQGLVEFFGVLKGGHPSNCSVRTVVNILRIFGLYKKDNDGFVYKTYNICIHIYAILILVSAIMVTIFDPPELFLFCFDMVFVAIGCLVAYKIFHYSLNRTTLQNLITEFERHFLYENDISDFVIKTRRKYYIFEMGFLIILFSQTSLFALIATIQVFLKFKNDFIYYLACVREVGAFSLYVFGQTLFDVLSIAFFLQTCLHIEVLCYKLRQIGRDGNYLNAKKQIANAVKEHQYILRSKDVQNELQNGVYMGNFIVPTLMIVLCAFLSTKSFGWSNKFYNCLVTMIFGIHKLFIYCFAGDQVLNKISEAVYESGWIGLPKEQQKDLMFIAHFSQRPLIYKAWPFFDICLPSFLMLMNAAISYALFLRTMDQMN